MERGRKKERGRIEDWEGEGRWKNRIRRMKE